MKPTLQEKVNQVIALFQKQHPRLSLGDYHKPRIQERIAEGNVRNDFIKVFQKGNFTNLAQATARKVFHAAKVLPPPPPEDAGFYKHELTETMKRIMRLHIAHPNKVEGFTGAVFVLLQQGYKMEQIVLVIRKKCLRAKDPLCLSFSLREDKFPQLLDEAFYEGAQKTYGDEMLAQEFYREQDREDPRERIRERIRQ